MKRKKQNNSKNSPHRQEQMKPSAKPFSTKKPEPLDQNSTSDKPAKNIAKVDSQPNTGFWRRKLLLEEKHIPLWSVILGGLAIIIASVAIVLSYIVPWNIQTHNDESGLSKIGYAFFIKPAPVPGEEFKKTKRWEVSVMILNSGPATAQAFILHLHTPDPQLFLHSEPKVMSSPAAADIQINKRIPNGHLSSSIQKFSARRFLLLEYVLRNDG
jgi:hypothetical protein